MAPTNRAAQGTGGAKNAAENPALRDEQEEDPASFFKAWLENIATDFRNGNHLGDPRAIDAMKRNSIRTRDANSAGKQPTPYNQTENGALNALNSLSSKTPDVSTTKSETPITTATIGGGSNTQLNTANAGTSTMTQSNEGLVSMRELLRTA
jgi:hypothetical protein